MRTGGKSECTLRTYKSHINGFCRWFADSSYSEDDPTPEAVLDFKKYLSDKGASSNTIRHYLVALSNFFQWASDPNFALHIDRNPISRSMLPSHKNKNTPYEEFLTEEEILKLLRNREYFGKGKKSKEVLAERNYALIVTALTTGLRESEIASLTTNDVDFKNMRIRVKHGKGDKFRLVAMPEICADAIRSYMRSGFRPANSFFATPLFGTYYTPGRDRKSGAPKKWKALTSTAIENLVKSHIYSVTGKKLSPHKLRHVYSRTLLQAGAPVEEIQSMLGHSDLKTTQIYTGRLLPRTENSTAYKVFGQMCNGM